jgi:hypothetical protein
MIFRLGHCESCFLHLASFKSLIKICLEYSFVLNIIFPTDYFRYFFHYKLMSIGIFFKVTLQLQEYKNMKSQYQIQEIKYQLH